MAPWSVRAQLLQSLAITAGRRRRIIRLYSPECVKHVVVAAAWEGNGVGGHSFRGANLKVATSGRFGSQSQAPLGGCWLWIRDQKMVVLIKPTHGALPSNQAVKQRTLLKSSLVTPTMDSVSFCRQAKQSSELM